MNTITNADEKKKKEKLRELNEDTHADLILSIGGETEVGRVMFQLVRGAKTDELKDGDAKEAWDRLTGKFEAQTAPSHLLLKSQINGLKLKYSLSASCTWVTWHFVVPLCHVLF